MLSNKWGAFSKKVLHSHGPSDFQQREKNLDPVHDAALAALPRKHILQQLLHALLPAGNADSVIATNILTEVNVRVSVCTGMRLTHDSSTVSKGSG